MEQGRRGCFPALVSDATGAGLTLANAVKPGAAARIGAINNPNMGYPTYRLSAPLFVVLGYKFGADIESLTARIARGERNVIIAILAMIVVVVLVSRWRSKRNRATAVAALEEKLHPHSGPGVEVRADRVEER